MWQYIVIFVAGYLIGSINISVLVTKFIGKKDIRSVGSGNAGGTNVARAMGAKWGIAVIIIDMDREEFTERFLFWAGLITV